MSEWIHIECCSVPRRHLFVESVVLKFCDRCGSYVAKTREGYLCRRCGRLTPLEPGSSVLESWEVRSDEIEKIVVMGKESLEKVSRECPRCRNRGAYRWVSSFSGEHAGVRRERDVEHLRCVRCGHTWAVEM